MQYGDLISRSLQIFWRHKYLWLLGALGGSEAAGGGFGPLGNAGSGAGNGTGQTGPPSELSQWFVDALPLLIVLGVLLVLFLIGYFLISCVTTGALVRGAAEHDAERPFALSAAWQAGVRTFWPILGLRVLVFLLALVAVGVLAGVFVVGIVSAVNDQIAGAVVAFVLGATALLVFIVLAIAASIVLTLTIRSIVLEQRSVFAALGRGLRLLSERLGRTLLVWLLSIVLGIVVGLIGALALLVLALPFAAVALAVYAAAGLAGMLTAAAVLIFLFILISILVGGAIGSYISIYWTLAFRRLELDAAPARAA